MKSSEGQLEEILGQLIILEEQPGLEQYESARIKAKEAAAQVCSDPMLLAWRDQAEDKYWPSYECGTHKRPPWIVWAAARGANLTVRIGQRWFFYFLCWREKG